ncbi:MAG: type II CAAX endopeptidase family protein [Actinomycetota bacterium]
MNPSTEVPGSPEQPPPPRPDARAIWPPATWALHETLAVAMAPFGIALVATIGLIAFGADGSGWLVVLTVIQQLALGLGVWGWVRAHTGSVRGLGLQRGGWNGRDVGAAIAAGIGALVASGIVIALTQDLTGTAEVANPLRSAGDAWVIPNAMLALVMAPVCEEIAFRGFLFGGLRRRFRFWWAGALSAALFALIHGDPVRMPALFVSGIILAAVYERRRTLVAPMVTHGVVNLVSVAAFAALS